MGLTKKLFTGAIDQHYFANVTRWREVEGTRYRHDGLFEGEWRSAFGVWRTVVESPATVSVDKLTVIIVTI